MYCVKCGKELLGNEEFCGKCGAKINVSEVTKKVVEEVETEEVKKEEVKTEKVMDEVGSNVTTKAAQQVNIHHKGVRDVLYDYIDSKPYLSSCLGSASVLLLFVYPAFFILSLLFPDTDIIDICYNMSSLLEVVSLLGVVLCLAKKQSHMIAIASGAMALGYVVTAAQNDALTFNTMVKMFFFAAICIWCIRDYMDSAAHIPKTVQADAAVKTPGANDLSSVNSNFFSKHKKGIIIAVIAAIVLLLIIIISSNSGYICSQCGKRFHEGKNVFGEYWCNDCFYN